MKYCSEVRELTLKEDGNHQVKCSCPVFGPLYIERAYFNDIKVEIDEETVPFVDLVLFWLEARSKETRS